MYTIHAKRLVRSTYTHSKFCRLYLAEAEQSVQMCVNVNIENLLILTLTNECFCLNNVQSYAHLDDN